MAIPANLMFEWHVTTPNINTEHVSVNDVFNNNLMFAWHTNNHSTFNEHIGVNNVGVSTGSASQFRVNKNMPHYRQCTTTAAFPAIAQLFLPQGPKLLFLQLFFLYSSGTKVGPLGQHSNINCQH